MCRVGDHVMEKELIYEKLPADIAERHVLVMDPILATGNSAIRAIQAMPLPFLSFLQPDLNLYSSCMTHNLHCILAEHICIRSALGEGPLLQISRQVSNCPSAVCGG